MSPVCGEEASTGSSGQLDSPSHQGPQELETPKGMMLLLVGLPIIVVVFIALLVCSKFVLHLW